MSDITDALNISGALAIKYNNLIDGTGKGTFVNSNKIKDADINLLISVRVINQTVHDYSLTEFSPIPDIDTSGKFTEIYGDCFISGFQEGGEFNAIVSIKVKDQNQKEDIAADAAISLTTPSFGSGGKDKKKDAKPKEKEKGEGDKNSNTDETGSTEGEGEEDSKDDEEQDVSEEKREPASSKDPGGLSVKGNAEVKKERQDILKENETTISVTWSGGGQELKEPDEDWNVEILRKAALRFPEMVAKTPVRTHSILTKYTSLKSYNAQRSGEKIGNPLSYENAGLYTTILQDVFLDYKNLFKDITLLEADVDAGKKKLTKSEFNETPLPQLKSKAGDGEGQSMTPKPFDPTFTGLECAKLGVRHMMNMIVAEVDVITKDPSIANKDRTLPCECPTIFRQYLPVAHDP